MSSRCSAHDAEAIKKNSRGVSWYVPELVKPRPEAWKLLEEYSKIPLDQVNAHVISVRERAWDIFPYPCIGRFHFLDLSVSLHPSYSRILSTLKDPNSHHTLLDLGCCFAQDIRKLIYDGVPSERLYACDLEQTFIDLGYELFADRRTCKTHFFTADVLKEGGTLDNIEGNIDAIYTGSFLHLFNWEDQVKICKRIVKTLKPQKGSIVFGRQTGNINGQVTEGAINKISGSGEIWKHSVESFHMMWDLAGRETGTHWRTTVEYDDEWDSTNMPWHEEGFKKVIFEVERLE